MRLYKRSVAWAILALLIVGVSFDAKAVADDDLDLDAVHRIVKLYLYTVEKNQWDRAFQQYLHPSLQTQLVKYLPDLMNPDNWPDEKQFQSLNIFWSGIKSYTDGVQEADVYVAYNQVTAKDGETFNEQSYQMFGLVREPGGDWKIVGMQALPQSMAEEIMLLLAFEEVQAIGIATEIFFHLEGRYPTSVEMLTQGENNILVKAGLLTDFGMDPWKRPYLYAPPDLRTLTPGMIWSNGPDGRNDSYPGTPQGDEHHYELYYILGFPGE